MEDFIASVKEKAAMVSANVGAMYAEGQRFSKDVAAAQTSGVSLAAAVMTATEVDTSHCKTTGRATGGGGGQRATPIRGAVCAVVRAWSG